MPINFYDESFINLMLFQRRLLNPRLFSIYSHFVSFVTVQCVVILLNEFYLAYLLFNKLNFNIFHCLSVLGGIASRKEEWYVLVDKSVT